MTPVVVRRSAVKMWLLAIVAVPFVLYGADVLLQQRFVGAVLDLIHPDGELPGVETRDYAWAWVFVIAGGLTAGWALKELILPRKIVEADGDRLVLRLGGPFGRPAEVEWDVVRDVRASRASDDGDVFPVLVIELDDVVGTSSIPVRPWGARWVKPHLLAIAAREWDRSAARVAEQINALEQQPIDRPAALEPSPPGPHPQARPARPPQAPSIWQEPRAGTGFGWARPRQEQGDGDPDGIDPSVRPSLDEERRSDAVRAYGDTSSELEPAVPLSDDRDVAQDVDPADAGPADTDGAVGVTPASPGDVMRMVPADAEHWSAVDSESASDSPPRRFDAHLPQSRFTVSHWIILDDDEHDE